MSTTLRIATGIVAALALATAAPASATPWDPNSRDPFIPIRPAPEPAMVSPAPSHAGRGPVASTSPAVSADHNQAGWVVRPNPDQQAAELARAAAARPAATKWVVRPNPDEQNPTPAPATIVRVTSPTGGFDWGDAGIGAAGGVALAMIGLGGALAGSQSRPRRNTHTTSLT